MRKLYHNELSENYAMEGKMAEKAFKDDFWLSLFSFIERIYAHLLNVFIVL